MQTTSTNTQTTRPAAILIACALFLSPLLYYEAFFYPAEVPRYVLISIIAIFSSAILIRQLWKNNNAVEWHAVNIAILTFTFLTCLSGLWALDNGGYYLSIIPFIALILIYFVNTHLHQYSVLFFSVTLASASYAAIIGLLQNQGIDPFSYRDASVMGSTFTYKNHAALYFDLVIPTSLSLILITKHTGLRWLITLASAICISYTLESHTRGSWLALGLTLLAFIIFITINKTQLKPVINAIKKVKLELIAITLITCTTLYSPSKMDETWSREALFDEEVLDTSSSIRLSIYKNSLSMLIDKPTGVGFGSFWKGFREYTNYPEVIPFTDMSNVIYRAHSEPIQFFLELGFVGGGLVIFIFIYLIVLGVRNCLHIEDTNHRIINLGITCSLLASAIHGAVDFPLHKPSSALQFWVLAGLLVGYTSLLKTNKPTYTEKQVKGLLAAFTILIIIVTPLSAKLYYAYVPGSIHHQNAVLAMNEHCDVAVDEIDQSLTISPYFFRTHNSKVDIYIACVQDNNKILHVLNLALQNDSNNSKALIKRAYINLEQMNYTAAYKDFTRVKRLLPHRVYGDYGIAQTLLSSGNIQQGLEILHSVIDQHPDFEYAKKQLDDVEKMLNNARRHMNKDTI